MPFSCGHLVLLRELPWVFNFYAQERYLFHCLCGGMEIANHIRWDTYQFSSLPILKYDQCQSLVNLILAYIHMCSYNLIRVTSIFFLLYFLTRSFSSWKTRRDRIWVFQFSISSISCNMGADFNSQALQWDHTMVWMNGIKNTLNLDEVTSSI